MGPDPKENGVELKGDCALVVGVPKKLCAAGNTCALGFCWGPLPNAFNTDPGVGCGAP